MDVNFRLAIESDIDRLLPMMRDFYEFEHLPYDAALLRKLMTKLMADDRLGRLILFESQSDLIGYMVLGFGFSLEFHGRDCFMDEFYVCPQHRSQGIGAAAVGFALKLCREQGIEAVHLEADHTNVRGHDFYKRLGFKDHARHLMTKWI